MMLVAWPSPIIGMFRDLNVAESNTDAVSSYVEPMELAESHSVGDCYIESVRQNSEDVRFFDAEEFHQNLECAQPYFAGGYDHIGYNYIDESAVCDIEPSTQIESQPHSIEDHEVIGEAEGFLDEPFCQLPSYMDGQDNSEDVNSDVESYMDGQDNSEDVKSDVELSQQDSFLEGKIWEETLADSLASEEDSRRGGDLPTELNSAMMHDVQLLVSRLVAKADKLIQNFTTNLAENWMQIRCKFEGGKVINRIQSGSWENRCTGAALQKNFGKSWGPKVWNSMTGVEANTVFVNAAESSAKKADKDKKRKSSEASKNSRRRGT